MSSQERENKILKLVNDAYAEGPALKDHQVSILMPVAIRTPTAPGGIKSYYQAKIEAAELTINQKTQNLRRLEAQRNALNARGESMVVLSGFSHSYYGFPVRLLREELQLLHEPGSYVGEVVKVMGKTKVLVKVQPEGKYSQCQETVIVWSVLMEI